MPWSPLFFPVLVYPLCKRPHENPPTASGSSSENMEDAEAPGVDEKQEELSSRLAKLAAKIRGPRATGIAPDIAHKSTQNRGAQSWLSRIRALPSWVHRHRCRKFHIGTFSREEMVWITSMIAAGGSFAPAYQWIATIDTDYGEPLNHWQKFVVVLCSQLFGWSLGQMLRHVFVGRGNGMIWPDNLPLSFLIQTLFPRAHTRKTAVVAGGKAEADNGGEIHLSDSSVTITGEFVEDTGVAKNGCGGRSDKVEIYEVENMPAAAAKNISAAPTTSASPSSADGSTTMSRKRHLALLTVATFVYQFIISYIAPVFKSLCLLCVWAPRSKLMSLLGSGWDGAGILSLTFDWTAMGTLQPLVSPLWAQLHYYLGALLMMYILTPLAWTMNWWDARNFPIVSTNVFDVGGNVYNISLIQQASSSSIFDYDPLGEELAQMVVMGTVSQNILSTKALPLAFNAYSPVRLSVNGALGYIFSVAAITAAAMHLAIWHPQWLRQAVSDITHAILRLWDPRLLFHTQNLNANTGGSRRGRTSRWSAQVASLGGSLNPISHNSAATLPVLSMQESQSSSDVQGSWDLLYISGRIGRLLILTLSLGTAMFSAQMGISKLPGWQIFVAVIWAIFACLPTGFVEAVTGFTLPIDLLPHILAGWMQAPGKPIETSYFHLWATVPVQVALGWSGVRSYQLVHHCCIQPPAAEPVSGLPQNESPEDKPAARAWKQQQRQQQRNQLPWMKRGLLIGIIWGACVNHLSYIAHSSSRGQARTLPIEMAIAQQPQGLYADETENIVTAATADSGRLLGWHEEGEFGRLPAALSSELVVWGIVGPQSLFAFDSPYRLIFVYGSLIGSLLPPMLYAIHRVLLYYAAQMECSGRVGSRPWLYRVAVQGAGVAKEVQVPLVLMGMVAVPTIPANFMISGLLVAVIGQYWCRYQRKTLADRSLYSAAMDTGTRMSVAVLFVIGQFLLSKGMPLSFVNWWGNQVGNVERCLLL
ncbi:hypothetical protein GGF37_002004 [Kickxella alabastrina]|nr:hypothetical protein GGF37_002004 [Kickxella alabastrina]